MCLSDGIYAFELWRHCTYVDVHSYRGCMWYIFDYGIVFNIKYVNLVLMYSVIAGGFG